MATGYLVVNNKQYRGTEFQFTPAVACPKLVINPGGGHPLQSYPLTTKPDAAHYAKFVVTANGKSYRLAHQYTSSYSARTTDVYNTTLTHTYTASRESGYWYDTTAQSFNPWYYSVRYTAGPVGVYLHNTWNFTMAGHASYTEGAFGITLSNEYNFTRSDFNNSEWRAQSYQTQYGNWDSYNTQSYTTRSSQYDTYSTYGSTSSSTRSYSVGYTTHNI